MITVYVIHIQGNWLPHPYCVFAYSTTMPSEFKDTLSYRYGTLKFFKWLSLVQVLAFI